MDSYSLHLAMAALVGASFVAVSAFYMHRKTLNQLLDFAKIVERERAKEEADDELGTVESPRHWKKNTDKRRNHGRKKSNSDYRRASASLPDVTAISGYADVDDRLNGTIPVVDGVSTELPKILKLPSEKSTGVTRRTSNLIRPTSPKSPVANASAFESVEGSDEEDNMTDIAMLDDQFIHTNGDVGPENNRLFQELPDATNANREAMPLAASSMTHNVSGDVHGVQPDPVAADILRKEPEHETFVRLKISPTERPTPEEEDVYKSLQACLELRESYVFREAVVPWETEVIHDPSTPKPNLNPFGYTFEGKSEHYFQMEDGVVHVYANKDCEKPNILFDGSSTSVFI